MEVAVLALDIIVFGLLMEIVVANLLIVEAVAVVLPTTLFLEALEL